MKTKTFFKDYFFSLILVASIIVVSIFSFYRFIIKQDYIVSYEGKCEITSNNCFLECDNDSCTENHYYSKMQKYAPDLYNECGKDITDCANANICLPNDQKCSITYCDPENDGDTCKKATPSESAILNDEQSSSTNNTIKL